MSTNTKIFIIILVCSVLLLILNAPIDERIGTFTKLGLLGIGCRLCVMIIGAAVGFRLARDLRKKKEANPPDPKILLVRIDMINGVIVNKNSIASRIFDKGEDLKTYEELDITDDEGNVGTPVRLQIDDGWYLHFGAPDYDIDHRGHWGAGWVPRGCTIEEAQEIANDLVNEAADAAAQAKL